MLVAAVAYLFPVKDGSYISVGLRTWLERRGDSISFSTVSLVITLFYVSGSARLVSSSSVVVVAGTGLTLLSEASGEEFVSLSGTPVISSGVEKSGSSSPMEFPWRS